MASAEVEIEDGFIVAASDPTGSHWTVAGGRARGNFRRVTHLLVLAAAVVPMSVTLAWARPGGGGGGQIRIQQPESSLAQTARTSWLETASRASAMVPGTSSLPPTSPSLAPAQPIPPVPGGVGYHFPWGQCTWYVSTRRYIPWSGDAWSWYGAAQAMGYSVGRTPRPGAIMVSKEGYVGHVAYVESVKGSTFTISEMNYKGLGVVDERTLTLDSVPLYGFIY
ncbi:MAG TPA: CHAP domain-containing protein [Candidatus Solibacter sp.]|nr:CHAP domain-containing protein [Candidatus Solibacter sp.]